MDLSPEAQGDPLSIRNELTPARVGGGGQTAKLSNYRTIKGPVPMHLLSVLAGGVFGLALPARGVSDLIDAPPITSHHIIMP